MESELNSEFLYSSSDLAKMCLGDEVWQRFDEIPYSFQLDKDSFIEKIPELYSLLAQDGYSDGWTSYVVLSLARDSENNLIEDRASKIRTFILVAEALRSEGTHVLPVALQIIIDTIHEDTEDHLRYYNHFIDKLINVASRYSKPLSEGINFNPDLQPERCATKFTEEISVAICSEIIGSFVRSGVQIGLDIYTGQANNVEETCGRKTNIEFFRSCGKEVIVRCGYMFFVDSKFQSIIPKKILDIARNNIVFLENMEDTEMGCRLGYFTCNTIASLMDVDLTGKTVLDCGSGTSNLSLVISKMGAKKVTGMEIDKEQIAKAQKNILANQAENSVFAVRGDLSKTDQVIGRFCSLAASKEVVIVSNLGYWIDYPISNATNLSLIKDLERAGYLVTDVVVGGHSPFKHAKLTPKEERSVKSLCNLGDIPKYGHDLDQLILERMGFSVVNTDSDKLIAQSTMAVTAKSIWGHR